MQKRWLFSFDKSEYESVFARWNNQLREESQARVIEICERFKKQENMSNQMNLAPFVDDELALEERIENIILRVYNRNPNVYIKIGLEHFIDQIVDELEKVQQSLYQLKSFAEKSPFSGEIIF